MKKYKLYIVLAIALLVTLSLPVSFARNLRAKSVALLSPLFNGVKQIKETDSADKEKELLRIENRLLKEDLSKLQELLQNELLIEEDRMQLQGLSSGILAGRSIYQRRYDELLQNLELKLNAVSADVIYRATSTWDNTLWINVGEKTNEKLGRLVVSKNSPVIIHNAVVGLVDYVGENASMVRLITDHSVHPSVRVARGGVENRPLLQAINTLVDALKKRTDLLADRKDNEILIQNLQILQRNAREPLPSYYFAKGDLCGACRPKYRSLGYVLKGVGFNYDYDDEEGPARDLRTGKLASSLTTSSTPIIQVGDLLVTTGMDGVFPAGLDVAEVTSIQMLKEGDFAYEIEATPKAFQLDQLQRVFVLPSIGFSLLE
ncbi:MAG: rod shape-determining protein MreC [Chlamydiales bacterium]|nr:rod shape-determining protein MreC [Chlamydiales bacterium]